MVTKAPGAELRGRQRERDVLDRTLKAARDGQGAVLALYGEPGVGKTALLDYAVEAAPDFRLARAVGVEGEVELAFAALQQLCSPSLDLIEYLPGPQREAMEVALGLSAGRASESVSRRPRRPQPAVGGCGGAAAPRCRRRRPVARPSVGARARVRGASPAGGEDRARLRGTPADRGACGVRGAPRRAAGPS